MSSFLYLVYRPPATMAVVESELHPYVVEKCAGQVLNNALQGFRLNLTIDADDIWAEPFIAGASICALVRNRRKHSTITVFLQAMFDWAASRGFESYLLIITNRPRHEDKNQRFDSALEFAAFLQR